jgi:hypothetical protein
VLVSSLLIVADGMERQCNGIAMVDSGSESVGSEGGV